MKAPHVLITGGEGDLGIALAARFRAASMLVSAPGKLELNVADRFCVKSYFTGIGGVDLLVCNAGITNDRPLARMSESDWDGVVDVNLKGAFLCAREAAKMMVKHRVGHIIFISSFSALHPPAGQANYAAAKSALLGMMKSLAQELGPRNIRVNAILPGFLETKMTSDLSGAVKEQSLNRHTLGRFNTSATVADFVVFLHEGMPHTSGQVFNLDSRILS